MSTVLLRKYLLLTYNFLCYDGGTDVMGYFYISWVKDSYTVSMPTISYKQQCGGMCLCGFYLFIYFF